MIRVLLGRNLRRHSILLLVLCAGFIVLQGIVVYVAVQVRSGPDLISLIQQLLPPMMAEMIAAQVGLTFGGMISFGFQHPAVLTGSLAMIIMVGTIPAAERESGWLELVLARPVRRWQYFIAVVLQIALCALILPLALVVGIAIGLQLVEVVEEAPLIRFVLAGCGLGSLLLCIGGYTLLLASSVRRRGSAIAGSVGMTLVFFWLDLTAQLWPPLRKIQWLSPFNYFEPIRGSQSGIVILLVIFAVTTGLALWRFERQDL